MWSILLLSFGHSVMSDSLQPYGLQPTRLLCPWDFLGKNTRVGCHFLLQGIFPNQASNLRLLHCRQILYHLSHQGRSSLSSRRKSNSMEERIFFSSWKFPIYFMLKFQKHFAYQHSPTSLSVFLAQIIHDLLWIPFSYLQYHFHDQWILLSKILFSCHQILLVSIQPFQLNIRSKHELESMYELLLTYIHLSSYLVSGF